MRKAEDIAKRYKSFIVAASQEEVIRVIEQIQIEAIDEAVKLCADKTNLIINSLSSTDKDFDDDYQCGDIVISVNRQSILSCADILKKEL